MLNPAFTLLLSSAALYSSRVMRVEVGVASVVESSGPLCGGRGNGGVSVAW